LRIVTAASCLTCCVSLLPGTNLSSHVVKSLAVECGFDACGIAAAADWPELRHFRDWLDRGFAGEMAYLHRSAERRADVRHVLPSARTVIVTATVYNTDRPYSTESTDPDVALVARYAWGDDYHDVLTGRLEELLSRMRERSPEPFEARAYVDTGPVQERVYAQRAGIGWVGKNTCLINPNLGSFVFLGEILCSLDLDVDESSLDQCGSCTLCLEACPTQAFLEPGVLDSTRCISYSTIELRGEIPAAAHAGIGSHIYGCDICQEVCPWNGLAPRSTDQAWQPRSAWDRPSLSTLARTSDADLATSLQGSAMRRAKIHGLRRNIAVALANAEDSQRSRR
jgi:epoxyqueuosine reductase